MSKAVVTGAGGFIGYHLAQDLAQRGVETIGIDLQFPSSNGALPEFSAVQGDFRDNAMMSAVLKDVDCLFHLASAHLQINLADAQYWDVNVHSIPKLLTRANEVGVKRCVHVSSVGIYGDVGPEYADEETPPSPLSIYGETKWKGEQVALQYANEYGFDVVVIRPAWVYGPGCPRTRKLYEALRTGKFIMFGNGRNKRHPVYISDMLDALRSAAQREGVAGETFIIAGERAITTRELIDSFCSAFDLAYPKLRLPMWCGSIAATGAETICAAIGREPPLSRRTLEFFQSNNAFSIEKARSQLDYSPKFDIYEGLTRTARSYTNEGISG